MPQNATECHRMSRCSWTPEAGDLFIAGRVLAAGGRSAIYKQANKVHWAESVVKIVLEQSQPIKSLWYCAILAPGNSVFAVPVDWNILKWLRFLSRKLRPLSRGIRWNDSGARCINCRLRWPDLNWLTDPLGHAHIAIKHSRTAGDGSWLPTMLEQKPRFVAEFCTFEVTRCPLKQRDFKMHAKQKVCPRHVWQVHVWWTSLWQRVRTGLPSMSEPMSPSTPETKQCSTAMLSCSSCSLHGALGNKISNTIYV